MEPSPIQIHVRIPIISPVISWPSKNRHEVLSAVSLVTEGDPLSRDLNLGAWPKFPRARSKNLTSTDDFRPNPTSDTTHITKPHCANNHRHDACKSPARFLPCQNPPH